jgi:hypothetical protein
MDYSFLCGLYDSDGDCFDKSLLVFIGDDVIVKFKDSKELEEFAKRILNSLPEIRYIEDK